MIIPVFWPIYGTFENATSIIGLMVGIIINIVVITFIVNYIVKKLKKIKQRKKLKRLIKIIRADIIKEIEKAKKFGDINKGKEYGILLRDLDSIIESLKYDINKH